MPSIPRGKDLGRIIAPSANAAAACHDRGRVPFRRTLWIFALSAVLVASPLEDRGAADSPQWPGERTEGVFRCHADFPLETYHGLFQDMRGLQQHVVEALELPAPQTPIHVFLFERRATYEHYVSYYFPNVPQRRALFIKSRGSAMVFAYHSDDLPVDVRHECTHAVLHSILPVVPLWLDEGLAEYFEVTPSKRENGHPHMRRMRWATRLGQVPELEALEKVGELQEMTLTHYQHAWAWVHFLLHGPPAARDELRKFLADIAANVPPGDLSARLKRRLPDVHGLFLDHYRSWSNDSGLLE